MTCLDDVDLPNIGDPLPVKNGIFNNGCRRVVDPIHMDLQLHRLFDDHIILGSKRNKLCDFSFKDLKLVEVMDTALRSRYTYVCKKCQFGGVIWSEELEESRMDIGRSVICASIQTGKFFPRIIHCYFYKIPIIQSN